jgi:hypothetical protein
MRVLLVRNTAPAMAGRQIAEGAPEVVFAFNVFIVWTCGGIAAETVVVIYSTSSTSVLAE